MELVKIDLPPGILKNTTDLGAEGRWKDGDKIRFHNKLAQPIGGWAKQNTTAFLGMARGSLAWTSNDYKKYLALGTNLKLYIWATTFNDITPLRASGTLGAAPFAMVNASTTVTVTDTAHGAIVNDYVTFGGASASNGITINGEYQVISVINDDSYTITHSAAATSTGSGGGGVVTYAYQINTGGQNGVFGLGWGAGTWGASTWGTARSTSNIFTSPRTWSFTLWGEDLIANPKGGGIYAWDTSVGTGTRAAVISGAPTTANAVLVSEQDRHLIAFGAHDGSLNQPMLIRWSDQEDYTTWTASATNTAGSKLLRGGSEILAAIPTQGEILVLTDNNAHTMQFVGGNFVYAFQEIAQNCGIIGPQAGISVDGRIFYMGQSDFYLYDGRVRTLPCDVHEFVYRDIEINQRAKCHAGHNPDFDEVWWFFPSDGELEPDKYVIYDYAQNIWSCGSMARTTWVSAGHVYPNPLATSTTGYMYAHESGNSDDGSALAAYVESGDFDMADGGKLVFMDRVIPDFVDQVGNITLTIKTRKYPQGTPTSKGPYTLATTSTMVPIRARGRQVAFRLASSGTSNFWRLGTFRGRMRPDGSR